MKISDEIATNIRELRYNPASKRGFCMVPLGSVLWDDEFPRGDICHPDIVNCVLKIFAIRIRYWDTGEMPAADRVLWEEARTQFPNWPVFRRLELSPEDLAYYRECKRETVEALEELLDDADGVEIEKKGDHAVTWRATTQVPADDRSRKPWWKFRKQ